MVNLSFTYCAYVEPKEVDESIDKIESRGYRVISVTYEKKVARIFYNRILQRSASI